MTYQPGPISDDQTNLPHLPDWVTSGRAETPEDVAFLSGAALNHLHLVVRHASVPQALVRERLALRAVEACMTHQGRPERAGELRDAVAFLKAGDQPGPSGEIYMSWLKAVERPVSVAALDRALPEVQAEQIASWLDAGQGGPVSHSAHILEAILHDRPRDDTTALLLADAVLAQALDWDHVVPLFVIGLKRADLLKRGDDLRLACHRAVVASVSEAARMAAELSWRVEHLKAVAPKLRAKGALNAVEMFRTCDAVTPSALPMPDRAARRLCDRLVELGAVRELSGRDTFRLYGI